MIKNGLAPVISEFCVVCRVYGPHDNGSTRIPIPVDPYWMTVNISPELGWNWKLTTQCQHCGWNTIYR